jgi:CARDB
VMATRMLRSRLLANHAHSLRFPFAVRLPGKLVAEVHRRTDTRDLAVASCSGEGPPDRIHRLMRLTCRQRRNLVAVGLGLLLPVGMACAVVPAGGAPVRPRRRAPDLLVSTVKAPGGRLTIGGGVTASVRTTNVGEAPSKRSRTGLYLSNDTKKSRDDILLGFVRVPTLKPQKSKRATIHGTVPSGTPPAGYRVLACADDRGRVHERNGCLLGLGSK